MEDWTEVGYILQMFPSYRNQLVVLLCKLSVQKVLALPSSIDNHLYDKPPFLYIFFQTLTASCQSRWSTGFNEKNSPCNVM